MVNMFDFEKFPVYLESKDFYAKALKLFRTGKIDKSIKDQLRRASASIVLNIAEGAGKYSKGDKKNFYLIARGSTNECAAIIAILKTEDVILDEEYKMLYSQLLLINKMLSGLINSMLK